MLRPKIFGRHMAGELALRQSAPTGSWRGLSEAPNGTWHEAALRVYLVVVLAHWMEHIVQTTQIWVLGWPLPQALRVLGLISPWSARSRCATATRYSCSSDSSHYGRRSQE
jgi:hypothetical protein